MDYGEFLSLKTQEGSREGFKPLWMPDFLFDFQGSLTDWGLWRGKSGIFADCGLGKSLIELVWGENVVRHTNKPVLLLTPLAVAGQIAREGEKFGIECVRTSGQLIGAKVHVTNYEKLHHFSPSDFGGVVCDESSAIKSFDGKRRAQVTEFLRTIPYRLLATATAAPNDYIELGTSSEALGHLGYMDMLSRFFINDQNTSKPQMYLHRGDNFAKTRERAKWRFKGHAEQAFWRWVCSWARACRKPSDLGFSDDRFILPELIEREHVVEAKTLADGMLFAMPAVGLREEREERRRTLRERCEKVAELVEKHDRSMIWCHLNPEGNLLEELIPNSIQVKGADTDEYKEMATEWFTGHKCICSEPLFRAKLAAWRRDHLATGANFIKNTANKDLQSLSATDRRIEKSASPICKAITHKTKTNGSSVRTTSRNDGNRLAGDTPQILSTVPNVSLPLKSTAEEILMPSSRDEWRATDLPYPTTIDSQSMVAPSVDVSRMTTPDQDTDSTLTIATPAEDSEDSCAHLAILGSESSKTIQKFLREPQCICGHTSGVRRLISKPSMFGWGLNLQSCSHVVTFASHSFEQYYQSVRRCWRFGQKNKVVVDLVATEGEAGIRENMRRKSIAADRMFAGLVAHMNEALRLDSKRHFEKEVEVPSWL